MVAKKVIAFSLVVIAGLVLVYLLSPQHAFSQTLKFGTSVKVSPTYYLPMMAAEEKGFWKAQGLDVEWVSFRGAAPMMRSVAAGHINIGGSVALGLLLPMSKGVPVVLVSEMIKRFDWFIYVPTASPVRKPEDLKGLKIGVVVLGGVEDAYGKAPLKALGLEEQTRFVAIGGVRQKYAALRTGAIKAMVASGTVGVRSVIKGSIRRVLRINDAFPKKWMEHSIFARKDFIKSQPETSRKAVKAVLAAINFINTNRSWTMAKVQSVSNFIPEMARASLEHFEFTQDGKIDREAIVNLRNFAIEYGIVSGKTMPPADDLFTRQFTG